MHPPEFELECQVISAQAQKKSFFFSFLPNVNSKILFYFALLPCVLHYNIIINNFTSLYCQPFYVVQIRPTLQVCVGFFFCCSLSNDVLILQFLLGNVTLFCVREMDTSLCSGQCVILIALKMYACLLMMLPWGSIYNVNWS